MLARHLHLPIVLALVSAGLPAHAQQGSAGRAGGGAPALAGVAQTGLGGAPVFSHLADGADFVAAGATTRSIETHDGQAGQLEPFGLFVPPLPPGAAAVRAFVCWNYLLDGEPPPFDLILVNGVAVTGDLVGAGTPDLCWDKAGAAVYLVSSDDIVELPVIHGVFNSFSFATDKALGADPLAFGDGLSVLCVYEIDGDPLRSVDVWSGYASDTSGAGTSADALLGFSQTWTGGGLRLMVNALDGQDEDDGGLAFVDDFLVNGTLASGDVAGTVEVGDAWQGLFAPLAFGAVPLNNLYDHADDDVSEYVTTPTADELLVSTDAPLVPDRDCIGHSLAAVSFALPAFAPWSPGKPGTGGLVPTLSGTGPLTPGSANSLTLAAALPGAPVTLVVGFSPLRQPFKGGVLGPSPDLLLSSSTSSSGKLLLSFLWPQSAPEGTLVWVQGWVSDPGASHGLSASNTLRLAGQ